MIVLTKSQILNIVKDQLSHQLGQSPVTIKTNINWLKFRHDKHSYEWTFTPDDLDDYILNYTILNNYGQLATKYITYQKLGDFISREYPGLTRVEFKFIVKDDDKLRNTCNNNEVMDLIDFNAKVFHDDIAKIEQDDLRELIDLSLLTGDKVWFQELTNTYKMI